MTVSAVDARQARQLGLTDEEFARICVLLGRDPNGMGGRIAEAAGKLKERWSQRGRPEAAALVDATGPSDVVDALEPQAEDGSLARV